MKLKHYITLCVACLCICRMAAAEETPPADSLVFSECTIDAVPGTAGSWIELYNRGDEEISAGGMTVVHNGRKLFTIPERTHIQPHRMVLVRFQESGSAGDSKSGKAQADAWRQPHVSFIETTDRKAEPQKYPGDRKPGYLALYTGEDMAKDKLVDFVCWSTKQDDFQPVTRRETRNTSVLTWANENDLWEDKHSVYVGGARAGGSYPYDSPPPPAVLYRLGFAKEYAGKGSWTVLPEDKATPGKGNVWPVPPLVTDGGLVGYFHWRFPPGVGRAVLHSKFPELARAVDDVGEWRDPKTEVAIARIQLSRTPHFDHIVWEKKIPQHTDRGMERLEEGQGYFARIRIDGERTSSEWSKPQWFKFHPQPQHVLYGLRWRREAWKLQRKMDVLKDRGQEGTEEWKQAKKCYEKAEAAKKSYREAKQLENKMYDVRKKVGSLKRRLNNIREKRQKGSSKEKKCLKEYKKAREKLEELKQARERQIKKIYEIGPNGDIQNGKEP